MSNIVKLYTMPEKLADDARLRELAMRALAPPDFPFDGLHIEAATVLGQLGLASKSPESRPGKPDKPTEFGSEAS